MTSLYKYGDRLPEYREAFLNNPNIKEADKKLIERFVYEYGAEQNNCSRTVYKYYTYLKPILYFLNEPLEKLSYEEYLRLRSALQHDHIRKLGSKKAVTYSNEPYSEVSKEDFDMLVRRILNWWRRYADEDVKVEIDKMFLLKPYKPDKNKMTEPDIFTEEEVLKMIKTATLLRDKALIAVLWETGARIGEILTLNFSSIKPLIIQGEDEKERKVGLQLTMVKSKTIQRTVPLIESAPYLQAYMNQHSGGDEESAPLWLMKDGTKRMSYQASRKMIITIAKKARINKRAHAHLFRHSRSTYLANKGWGDSQMNAWCGWKTGSKMPAVYIRRSGIDLTSAALKMHGIVTADSGGKAKLLPLTCHFCQHPNPQTHEFCESCHNPLDPTKIAEMQQANSKIINALVEQKINEILEKHGLEKV